MLVNGNSMRADVRPVSGLGGSQFAARRAEIAASRRRVLLDITGALHFAFGRRLSSRKPRVDGRSAGESRGKLLPDGGADALEFRDRRVLYAAIGHGLDRRLVGIGSVDRSQRQLRERRDLQIFRILIERGSRAGRPIGPSLLLGDELGVILAGGPGDEF